MGFRCIQLSKTFDTRQGEVVALQAVDLQVGDEEFVCIVGPSGCGKTTLLKLIAGLLQPTTGQIIFARKSSNANLSPGGRNCLQSAMVFQDQGIFPWMTVLDNVAFGLETQGVSRKERRTLAMEFLSKVGLGSFLHNYPHELSGGMRQRVAILRAFLADPQILLMDEPFGGLDSQTRLVIQEELLRIWRDYRKTVVYVTHDIEEAILLGDRVLVMSGRPGHILEEVVVPLLRPRELANSDPFMRAQVADIRWHIWKMLEDEVRKDLQISANAYQLERHQPSSGQGIGR